jgi:hypothetical protein
VLIFYAGLHLSGRHSLLTMLEFHDTFSAQKPYKLSGATLMKSIQKYISVILSVTLMSMSFTSTQAAMISNDMVINRVQHSDAKTELLQTINRSDVKQQLLNMGVKQENIESRINLMTHEEIAQLNQQIAELPAGGTDVLGVLLIIFLVFVITDIIGATDIFPFIKPVN